MEEAQASAVSVGGGGTSKCSECECVGAAACKAGHTTAKLKPLNIILDMSGSLECKGQVVGRIKEQGNVPSYLLGHY